MPAKDHTRTIERVGKGPMVGTMAAHIRDAGDQRDGIVMIHTGIGHHTGGEKSGRRPHPLARYPTQWMKKVVHSCQ